MIDRDAFVLDVHDETERPMLRRSAVTWRDIHTQRKLAVRQVCDIEGKSRAERTNETTKERTKQTEGAREKERERTEILREKRERERESTRDRER